MWKNRAELKVAMIANMGNVHLRRNHIWKNVMWVFFTAIFAKPVAAHPHYWVGLKADMILDQQGRLSTIRQHWDFDVYFSMMTVADAVNEHGDKDLGLSKMADQMIANMTKHRYFSTLTIDGEQVALPRPSSYRLRENKQQEPAILVLEMQFDFETPVAVINKNLSWSVFDPTYYVAMSYSVIDNISIKGEQAAGCKLSLDVPNPSNELIEYAQNLDRTQKDTAGLGIKFAEKIHVSCL
jgi:ABC-type uncharacterized transport system substrate-binding protein